ncbi:MAG TPA: phosphoribosylformylglycinamidine synthase I [Candidatus Nanoarchaeia archaeon]|nr:phosphoribosylformylglycinamidine synthase I [Candidatus Nanoarchaeia archaeon]
MKAAVILFPGMNCENETLRALKAAGFDADLLRWNTKKEFSHYDCFVLPGGFSYEDRIRAGVISAKDPVMERIKEEANSGKPVLGICNGAQVLIESGLVPGFSNEPQMALAPNTNPEIGGYYCVWVRIKPVMKRRNAYNLLCRENDVIDIPIAHGEGRFTTREDVGRIKDLIAFQFCNEYGEVEDSFPTNPNGSLLSIAGITNREGNVLAIMPHPERASFEKQTLAYGFKTLGLNIFKSMKRHIEEKK